MMMLDFMGVKGSSIPPEEPEHDHISNSGRMCTKSFEELTDHDVLQLTREDCRRYLKEKGMRRPSWNKAQAVQQVLALKSLCNTTSGSKRGHKNLVPTKATKLDKQPPPTSQLTMFYGGSVSVFEDVPVDKAYAMMLLAANVSSWAPSGGTLAPRGVLEMPQARKASLQRFLQRRKERFFI